jgi:hypothetical protein
MHFAILPGKFLPICRISDAENLTSPISIISSRAAVIVFLPQQLIQLLRSYRRVMPTEAVSRASLFDVKFVSLTLQTSSSSYSLVPSAVPPRKRRLPKSSILCYSVQPIRSEASRINPVKSKSAPFMNFYDA